MMKLKLSNVSKTLNVLEVYYIIFASAAFIAYCAYLPVVHPFLCLFTTMSLLVLTFLCGKIPAVANLEDAQNKKNLSVIVFLIAICSVLSDCRSTYFSYSFVPWILYLIWLNILGVRVSSRVLNLAAISAIITYAFCGLPPILNPNVFTMCVLSLLSICCSRSLKLYLFTSSLLACISFYFWDFRAIIVAQIFSCFWILINPLRVKILGTLFVVSLVVVYEYLNRVSFPLHGRVDIWYQSLLAFQDSPIFGHGQNFSWYLIKSDELIHITHGHNSFATIAVQLGLVGLSLFVLFCISIERFFPSFSTPLKLYTSCLLLLALMDDPIVSGVMLIPVMIEISKCSMPIRESA